MVCVRDVMETLRTSIFHAWCPHKGHTYLNKPPLESWRFVQVFMTFQLTLEIKWLRTLLSGYLGAITRKRYTSFKFQKPFQKQPPEVACNFIKIHNSCFLLKFEKNVKNTYFEEHLRMADPTFLTILWEQFNK